MPWGRSVLGVALSLGLFHIVPSLSEAQTYNWKGTTSSSWTTSTNWDPAVAGPPANSTVHINKQTYGGTFDPVLTSAPSNNINYVIYDANTLTFDGGFNVAMGSLTLKGGATGSKLVMAFDNANRSVQLRNTTTWTDEGGTLDQINGSVRVDANTRTFVGAIINGGTGTTGSDLATTAGSPVVTSASGSFVTANVKAGQCLRVTAGNDAGWYRIVSVDSATQLTVETALQFTGTASYEVRALPTFKHLKIATGTTGVVATGSCIRVTQPNSPGVAFNQDTGFRYAGSFTLGDGGSNEAAIMTESWGHDGGTFNANSGTIITTYSGDIPDDNMASGSGTPLSLHDIDMRLGSGDTANTISMPPADLVTCHTIRVRQGVTFNNANGRLIQLTGDWNNWGSYTGAVDAPDIVRFQGAGLSHVVRGTTQFSRIELISGSGPTTLDAGTDVSIAKYLLHAHALNGGSPATLTFLAGSFWDKTGTFTAQTGKVVWKKHGSDAAPQALPAADPFYNLTIDTTGTATASAGLSVGNDLNLLAGTFDAQTFAHTITGDFLLSGGFTASTSTIVMGGVDSEILKSPSTAGSVSFYRLTAGNSSGDTCTIAFGKTVTATNLFTIAAGSTLNAGSSTVLNTSTWTNLGTFSAGTGTVVWDPAASTAVPNETFYNLTIAGPSTGSAALTVNQTLRIDTGGPINAGTDGSLAAGGNNVTVKKNLVHNVAGGFSASGAGKLILNGTTQQQLSGTQPLSVNHLEIDKTGAGSAGTVVLAFGLAGDDFTISGTTSVLAGTFDLGGFNDTVVANGNVDIGDGSGAAASLAMVGGVTLKMAGGTLLRIRTDGAIESANTGSVPTLTSTSPGTAFYAIRVEGTVNVGAANIRSLATTATNTNSADNHGFTVTATGTFTAFDNVSWDTLQGSGANDTYLRVFRTSGSPAFAYTFNGHSVENGPGTADCNVFLDRGGQVASITYDASGGAMGGSNGETFDRNEAGADGTPGSIVWNVLFVWTGAVDTNWHTAGNWNLSAVPGATDSAQVPDVANDPVISSNASIKNLTIEAGAVLTCSGSPTFTVNGTWTLNGTFTAGNSTVVFAGTTSQTVPVTTYYNLKLSNTGGTNTPASPITVQSDFTIDTGVTLTATTATILVAGSWTNSGTYNPGSSLVRFNGTGGGTQVLTGETTFYHLEFTGSRTKRIDSAIDVNGNLTITDGATVSATDLGFIDLRIGGEWRFTNTDANAATSGVFVPELSTVIFDGGGTQRIVQENTSSAVNFNNLKTETTGTTLLLATSVGGPTSGTVTLSTDDNAGNANKGNVNVGSGTTFDFTNDTVNVGGNWTVNGSLVVAGSTVRFQASAAQSILTSSTFNVLRINNSSATAQVSATGALTIEDDLFVDDGILHMGAGLTHVIKDDATVAAGAEWHLGTSTVTVGVLNNGAYGDITVNGTLRMAGTASARPVLQITGDSGGYGSGSAATRPDFLVNGTLVATAVSQNQRPLVKSAFDTGALKPFFRFDAGAAAVLDFNGVTFDATDSSGLVLAAGVGVTNFDNVTFQNAAGGSGANFYVDLASWSSAGPDTAWTNVSFDAAAAKHIDASGATGTWFITFVDFTSPYSAEGSRESDPGSFVRWARTLTWTGSANSNFNNANNWSPQQAPTSTDRVIITDVNAPSFDPVVNADRTVFAVTIEGDGILTMNGAGNDLTVTGDFTIETGGTLVQSANNTLSVGGIWTDNGAFTQTNGTLVFTGPTARVMKGQGFLTVEVQSGATLTVGDGTTAATMTIPSGATFTVGNGGNATLVLKNNAVLQTANLAITATDTFTAEPGSIFRWMGAAMPAVSLTFYEFQVGDGATVVSASLAAAAVANCDLWIRPNASLALAGQTATVT